MKNVVVMHPSSEWAWVCSFPETPSEPPLKPHDQMIYDFGIKIESLRQQLAAMEDKYLVERGMRRLNSGEAESLRQQLAKRDAEVVALKVDAERYRWLCNAGRSLFQPAFAASSITSWKTKAEIDHGIDLARGNQND